MIIDIDLSVRCECGHRLGLHNNADVCCGENCTCRRFREEK
jgi:hypothetical protein